ncbi:MAG: helix-turn-helix domain-containing protein [Oscillospiraceae bacterium]|nr:helix-turn-helix domain-containing protein [Oscillospiraceae bacterium]
MRTLTLDDRRKIEMMWGEIASPVKIAAELGISQCTVYTELKRGRYVRAGGDVELDKNFRPAYSEQPQKKRTIDKRPPDVGK